MWHPWRFEKPIIFPCIRQYGTGHLEICDPWKTVTAPWAFSVSEGGFVKAQVIHAVVVSYE